MLAQPIARAFDLDDNGLVKQPIEQRGRDDSIPEVVSPLGKYAVRGQDHGSAFIAGIYELEEQIAAAGHDDAGVGRPKELDDLVVADEVELRESKYPAIVEGRPGMRNQSRPGFLWSRAGPFAATSSPACSSAT